MSVTGLLRTGLNGLMSGLPVGLKAIKYFVDSTFRDKVVPVPGSVLYCDLWLAVEHSGIYVGEGMISNIVVEGFAESSVSRSSADSFTSKSTLGRRIYVSCDRHGAVGHRHVAEGADSHVGERTFYGLVYKNCHQFSVKCVAYAGESDSAVSLADRLLSTVTNETWEPTLGVLKRAAHTKLGATKWRLWDWQADGAREEDKVPEPDWQEHVDAFRNEKLDAASIERIRCELAATRQYEAEIADENVPGHIRQRIEAFSGTLAAICKKYTEVEAFLTLLPGSGFSFADLQDCDEDFGGLAETLRANAQIRELARRMGRDYIAEEKKKRSRVPKASRSEVHGTHRSDELMRILPSELLNLEDETLEMLFYTRLLEKNLLSYELRGTAFVDGDTVEEQKERTGPVVACLDTSGSMNGIPLRKAKALLLAIARLLESENRSLHVLLFGSATQIREFSMAGEGDVPGLLRFLRQGFGGGTDFEMPLRRAFNIISVQGDYRKADVLMISDGDCQLSPAFADTVRAQKEALDCTVYSVLCAGARVEDSFSDAVMVL